jgi:uncharacterized membrane protein YraQ (UPF0718 family)
MIAAFLVLLLMALGLGVVAYRQGEGALRQGVNGAGRMFVSLIPLLVLAFLLAGLIQVALPPEVITSWLGEESGFRGVLIGTVAGALITGGPYVSFPIIAAIFDSGAGIGTTVALISGWAMLGLGQIPFEVSLIGPRFTLIRVTTVFFVPFVAGMAAHFLFGTG